MVNATPWPLYPRERDAVPIVQEAGWAPSPAERHTWATVQMTIKRTEVTPRTEKTVTLHKILVGKKNVKRPRVKPKNRHGSNITMILKKKPFDKVLAVI